MNYSIAAGFFVTLSLFFLFLENRFHYNANKVKTAFVVLYGIGVIVWIVLGVLMNRSPLVIISSLQIFFLALFFSKGSPKHEDG